MGEYIPRESWKSRVGFIFAALGSAVGLGSIWRFPYVVGENGGAAFILVYLFCLAIIGFPTLIAEILIGRTAQSSPSGAFRFLGRNRFWAAGGKMTIVTGFLVSSFYSVIAGFALGYFIEALRGTITDLHTAKEALGYFNTLSSSATWSVGFHFLFILLSGGVLFFGVRKGIEIGSKIMMPLLILVLIFLMIKGLALPSSYKGLQFLFSPNWKALTPAGILIALGQAFFTLSLGQGTMVTYGSYISRSEDVTKSCYPVVLINTIIGLMMGVAVFTIVFSVGLEPQVGSSLIFETLPIVFSQIAWGRFVAILFFFLVSLAALTSEISALEPMISYWIDEKGWSRKKSVLVSVTGAFIIGVPSALSTSYFRWGNISFFEIISFLCLNVLIPLGGFIAVMLVAYRWGLKEAFENLHIEKGLLFHKKRPLLAAYYTITLKFLAPLIILLILFHAMGLF